MNILLAGSGGREHALAWKIHQSPLVKQIFVLPGNGGTHSFCTNIEGPFQDFDFVAQVCLDNKIDLLVIGPEDPLVKGLTDFLQQNPALKSLRIVGPNKVAAQLEGSKDFSKQFMLRNGIPTASAKTFSKNNLHELKDYLKAHPTPIVVKADGLAAGKGVVICPTYEDAMAEVATMILSLKFGESSSKVVVEQFLSGVEVSFFVLSDGNSYVMLPEAKDYKKIGVGDTGPNTGGMGAVSPVPFCDEAFIEKVKSKVIEPTFKGLKKEHIPFVGFIFFGLIKVKDEPFVIEYNARLGDPETEAIMLRIEDDIVPYLVAAADGNIANLNALTFSKNASATLMSVSGGYPGKFETGKEISNPEAMPDVFYFHAGTTLENGILKTSGGRVISTSAIGKNIKDAVEKAFLGLKSFSFDGKYFRTDIGADL